MVPCPTFPRAGGVFKAPSCYFQLDPSSPSWSIKYGLRRKAEPVLESGGNRRVLEAEGGGTGRLSPSEAAGKQCALWAALPLAGKARSPAERLKSHSRLLPETSGPPSGSPPLCFSLLCPPSPQEGDDPRRRGRARWLRHTKKGYGQWDFRNKLNFGFLTFSNHKN